MRATSLPRGRNVGLGKAPALAGPRVRGRNHWPLFVGCSVSGIAPEAMEAMADTIYRRAFNVASSGRVQRTPDIPNGEYTLDELARLLDAHTRGTADGLEKRKAL
jgi:hypothetical protein